MEEVDIQQQFRLFQKEIEAAAVLAEQTKLDLLSAIDTLKIEVEVLRRFIKRHHPDFVHLYPQLREEVMQEVDPEWMELKVKKSRKE